MEQADIEGIAGEILESGGMADDEPPAIGKLARAHLGPECFDTLTNLPGDAALARVYDHWRIYLKRGLTPQRKAFAVAHELVEFWLKVHIRYYADNVEQVADGVAAALLCPRRAFQRALGLSFPELAEAFRISQTHAALRESEVTGHPRAVVSPKLVRVRGGEWIWGTENQLRRTGQGQQSMPGVVKTKLTDDPRRFVLDPVA